MNFSCLKKCHFSSLGKFYGFHIWTRFAVTKKLRSAKMSDVEDDELEKPEFLGLFSSGTPISGPLLQEKAKHFSAQLNAESTDRESFKASTGWLDKFKNLFTIKLCFLCFVSLHYCLINIHILDYPDYLFKSQRVRIIEARLYQVHGEDDP